MFKNNGQKSGKKAVVRDEKKAKLAQADAKVKKISKAMFFSKKATSPEAMQRAQLNG